MPVRLDRLAPDGDVEEHEHPVLALHRAARGGLVGEDLPLAEHDELAVDPLDRLHDVHVLTDDRRDVGVGGQPARKVELEGARLRDELIAPVEVDDHDLRAGAPRRPGRPLDGRDVRQVDRPRVRQRDSVRHLGIGEERDLDPLDPGDQDPSRRAGDGNEPVCRTPARSSVRPVSSIPYCPMSTEWFEAVSQIR